MLFQALEDKKDCVGIFVDDRLIFNDIPSNLTRSWCYSPFLKGKNIEYANLFLQKEKIEDGCPDHLKNEFLSIKQKLKAFLNSFIESKISLKDNCFYDLVPKKYLIDYCIIKNKITQYIFDNYKKPEEYDFFRKFNELLVDIKNRDLNIDYEWMKSNIDKDKDLLHYRKFINYKKNISYNLFGSVTGRLSTNKESFPILNYPKSYRSAIKPTNDWFVAFDMNAAELRTSLALIDKEQYEGDLYDKISKEIYGNKFPRKEVKQMTTAWLYNAVNPAVLEYEGRLDNLFEKENLINTYWDGKYIHTPFYRKIESDRYHVISYLNQSTFIDMFHRQVLKIFDFLQDKKSFISFLVHDEFVIDITDDEKSNLIEIVKILQNTEFGKFIVNLKVGKDYGNMKKINLKVD